MTNASEGDRKMKAMTVEQINKVIYNWARDYCWDKELDKGYPALNPQNRGHLAQAIFNAQKGTE